MNRWWCVVCFIVCLIKKNILRWEYFEQLMKRCVLFCTFSYIKGAYYTEQTTKRRYSNGEIYTHMQGPPGITTSRPFFLVPRQALICFNAKIDVTESRCWHTVNSYPKLTLCWHAAVSIFNIPTSFAILCRFKPRSQTYIFSYFYVSDTHILENKASRLSAVNKWIVCDIVMQNICLK